MRFQAIAPLCLAALAACSERDAPPREPAPAKIGACWGRPTIGEGGVGTVRVSRTVAQLARTCVTRDTSISVAGGEPQTATVVRYGGHELVAITTDDRSGTISNLIVTDPVFRTAAGVGVGSTTAELLNAYGRDDLCPLGGERGVTLHARSLPGVQFMVTWFSRAAFETARVREVWIYEPGLDAVAPMACTSI